MRVLCVIVCLGLASVAYSAEEAPLTLEGYGELVRERHPGYKRLALDVDQSQSKLRQYGAGRELSFSVEPSFSDQKIPVPIEGIPVATEQRDLGMSIGITKPVWATGGSLKLAVDSLHSDATYQGAGSVDYYQHGVSLTYLQPLLSNRGGVLDRLNERKQAVQVMSDEVNLEENQESLMLSMYRHYLDWVLLLEQLEVARERQKLAQAQLDQSERKFKVNLVDKVDVYRAQDSLQEAQQSLELVMSDYSSKVSFLSAMMASTVFVRSKPLFQLDRPFDLPEFEEAKQSMLQRSRVLKVLRYTSDQLRIQERAYVNQLHGRLDLSLTAGLRSADESFRSSTSLDDEHTSIGLMYQRSLGQTAYKEQLVQNRLDQASLDLQIEETSRDLSARLESVYVQAFRLKDILELNRQQLETSVLKTAEEKKLYSQGRGDLNFVISAQDSEQRSELNYLGNLARYQWLYLEYLALQDRL